MSAVFLSFTISSSCLIPRSSYFLCCHQHFLLAPRCGKLYDITVSNESSLHFRKLRLKEIADFLLIFLFSSFIYRHTVLCSLSQFAIFAVASTIFHLLFLPRRNVLSYLFSYISFSFLCSHISSSFSLRAFPSFPLATFVISIFI